MPTMTTVDGKRLYKVLSEHGESQNGGTMKWSLPSGDAPGEWHEVEHVDMCASGLHLTSEPVEWWKRRCRVFEVEADGLLESDGEVLWSRDNVVAKRVRLLRELTEEELAKVRIVRSGVHRFDKGKVIVEGSAKVTASGSASVRAYGSASVTAYDSAKVDAYDSASVRRGVRQAV